MDKLANVSLSIYSKDTGVIKYWGHEHYFENNLHMQLESDAVVAHGFKIASLLFNGNHLPTKGKPEFFSGLSINTTDKNKDGGTSPFIIVKKIALPKFSYTSGIFKYPWPKELHDLVYEHLGKTLNDYFFE